MTKLQQFVQHQALEKKLFFVVLDCMLKKRHRILPMTLLDFISDVPDTRFCIRCLHAFVILHAAPHYVSKILAIPGTACFSHNGSFSFIIACTQYGNIWVDSSVNASSKF